jgi:hypothetical protein
MIFPIRAYVSNVRSCSELSTIRTTLNNIVCVRSHGSVLSVRLLLGLGVALVLFPGSSLAQMGNVDTVEGPRGDKTTLTAQPHGIADGLSVRALGIAAPDTTRWALSLIGAAPDDEIALQYADESLPLLSVQRPDDGVGPTRVYVSQETFLTLAESSSVTLRVGSISVVLPKQLRREMTAIFERTAD